MKFYTNISQIGNNICYRGYNNGKRESFKDSFQPLLYALDSSGKSCSFKTLEGKVLKEISPGTISDTKEFVEQYKDTKGLSLYGNENFVCQYISNLYPQNQKADFVESDLSVVVLDIENETESGFSSPEDASERINVITVKHKKSGQAKKYVFYLSSTIPSLIDDTTIEFHSFIEEKDLLVSFIDLWKSLDPDVITGWNISAYDIPYTINRMIKILPENTHRRLSPWKSVREKKERSKHNDYITYTIAGVSILDYFKLYKKYTYSQQESYSLDNIAQVELGKSKIDYTEYDSLKEFYTKDFEKFIRYNIQDVDLVDELDDKLNLIHLHVSMAYTAKVNYDDVFYQIRTWDSIIYNYLKAKNIIIPFKTDKNKAMQYAGAYVKDPQVGLHKWVVSYDVASLYPNLIRLVNISPETVIDRTVQTTVDDLLQKKVDLNFAKRENITVGANGQCFRRDIQGMFPELMKIFFDERKSSKKKMLEYKKKAEEITTTDSVSIQQKKELFKISKKYDISQMSAKISINSLYGAIGTPYFRFYDIRLAEAVTLSGQFAIRWIQNSVNAYLNSLLKTKDKDFTIASDTDSVMLNLNDFVQMKFKGEPTTPIEGIEFLNKFSKSLLEPHIEKTCKELYEYLNGYEHTVHMERDVLCDRALWTAKKRYCMNVYDAEGVRYSSPKLKIMGIEVQRSSTPKICREKLKKSIEIILTKTEDDLVDFVDSFKKEFYKSSPEAIAFPRGVSDVSKYYDEKAVYKKGTPIAVKGALLYNHYIKSKNLTDKYNKIMDGDKVKFIYLHLPNILGSPVISFPRKIPKEWNLHSIIDYRTQFEKTFLVPLRSLLHVVGWSETRRSSLL